MFIKIGENEMKKFLFIYGKILALSTIVFSITFLFLEFTKVESTLITYVLYLLQKVVVLLLVFGFYFFAEKEKWGLGIQQNKGARHFVKGSVLGIIISLLSITLILVWGSKSVIPLPFNVDTLISTVYFLLFCFAVALLEEVLFRGYIQGLAAHHYNSKSGVIFSTLFFVAFHGLNSDINILGVLGIFLAGLLLAIMKEVSNGLWLGIGFHFMWNFIETGIFGFLNSDGPPVSPLLTVHLTNNEIITGGKYCPEGSIITIVLLLILILYIKKRNIHTAQSKIKP